MQAPMENVPNVRLRIVQPNVDQARKWRTDERERISTIAGLFSVPVAAGAKPVTHIIWPETASTFYLTEDAPHRAMIADNVPEGGAITYRCHAARHG